MGTNNNRTGCRTFMQNRLVADFTLTSNGEKAYVANQLSTDLAWNDVMMDIDGSYPNHQQVKMPKYPS